MFKDCEVSGCEVSSVVIITSITYSNCFNTSSQVFNHKSCNTINNRCKVLFTINFNSNLACSINRNCHINLSNVTNINISYINFNRSNKFRNSNCSVDDFTGMVFITGINHSNVVLTRSYIS